MARGGARSGTGARSTEVPYVLDSWAILAWLNGEEPARAAVRKLLKAAAAGGRPLVMCVLNLGEVYHAIGRTHGLDVAEQKRQLLLELPVQLEPVREPLVWRAARLEALYSLSSADTFAAALALALKTHLVTGDPEFEPIRLNEGLKVRWISRADKA